MKTAFIDTSVISECHRQGITAKILNEFLEKKKLIPVIGILTNFEIAKNILTDNPHKASQLYCFIRDLKPEYSQSRDALYKLEANKLKTDDPVDYLISGQPKNLLLSKMDDHCNGKFNYTHKNFLQTRQKILTSYRKSWQPIGDKEVQKKYNQHFSKYLADNLIFFRSNLDAMKELRQRIFVTTEQTINLDNRNISKLLDNLISYPALRSLIYVHSYLEFLTQTNGATPAEDRFTDALMMIESSYCTTIISNDESFMRKHAKNINPYIETVTLKKLISGDKTDITASYTTN